MKFTNSVPAILRQRYHSLELRLLLAEAERDHSVLLLASRQQTVAEGLEAEERVVLREGHRRQVLGVVPCQNNMYLVNKATRKGSFHVWNVNTLKLNISVEIFCRLYHTTDCTCWRTFAGPPLSLQQIPARQSSVPVVPKQVDVAHGMVHGFIRWHLLLLLLLLRSQTKLRLLLLANWTNTNKSKLR